MSLNVSLIVALLFSGTSDPYATETEYAGSKLTAQIIQQFASEIPLPPRARVLHIHDFETMSGGETTVQFELPPSALPRFLKDSHFKRSKLNATSIEVYPVEGSTWFSPEQKRDLERRGTFLSGSRNSKSPLRAILIDTSNPELYIVTASILRAG